MIAVLEVSVELLGSVDVTFPIQSSVIVITKFGAFGVISAVMFRIKSSTSWKFVGHGKMENPMPSERFFEKVICEPKRVEIISWIKFPFVKELRKRKRRKMELSMTLSKLRFSLLYQETTALCAMTNAHNIGLL